MDYEEIEAFLDDVRKGLIGNLAKLKGMPGSTMAIYNEYYNMPTQYEEYITAVQALATTDPARLRFQKYNQRRQDMQNLASDLDTAIRGVFTNYGITL